MNIHTDQIYRASSDEQGEIRNEINLQLNYFNNKKDFAMWFFSGIYDHYILHQ